MEVSFFRKPGLFRIKLFEESLFWAFAFQVLSVQGRVAIFTTAISILLALYSLINALFIKKSLKRMILSFVAIVFSVIFIFTFFQIQKLSDYLPQDFEGISFIITLPGSAQSYEWIPDGTDSITVENSSASKVVISGGEYTETISLLGSLNVQRFWWPGSDAYNVEGLSIRMEFNGNNGYFARMEAGTSHHVDFIYDYSESEHDINTTSIYLYSSLLECLPNEILQLISSE